jgi:hypothetical protein
MSDYAALAQRVTAGLAGIRGCLLLSRDGMVLGADPEGDAESQVKAAWLRFASVGEPERSYVEFPDQTWAFVRRGSYAAFVVADAGVRPGLLVDLLDQVLMAGEVERIHEREAMRIPEAPVAPSGKPRTILHRLGRLAAPGPQPAAASVPDQEVTVVRSAAASDAPSSEPGGPETAAPEPEAGEHDAGEPDTADAVEPDAAEPEAAEPEAGEPGAVDTEPEQPTAPDPRSGDPPPDETEPEEEAEVDRILLAKEFAGLLQVPGEDDEATR